ncbi:helix-turn-helix domain-containing protein [Thermoproteota archaeon]
MLPIPMKKESQIITIKEAAEILEVSKDTLRRWEQVGKLKTKRHPMNNYRIYNSEDIDKLKKIILRGKE